MDLGEMGRRRGEWEQDTYAGLKFLKIIKRY